MTWIKTVSFDQAGPELKQAIEAQHQAYPPEYAIPVESLREHEKEDGSGRIVMSHSLIPSALYHAFATYGALLSPDLPLTRQQHEMIAATVSSLNRCFY
jgi:hypothetical protein